MRYFNRNFFIGHFVNGFHNNFPFFRIFFNTLTTTNCFLFLKIEKKIHITSFYYFLGIY